MTNYDDPARWADYPAWSRAILDEYARSIRDLAGVIIAITPEQYGASTRLSDEEFPNLRRIMWHVVGAANRYVDYIEVAFDGVDVSQRVHKYAYDSPSEATGSLWEAFGRMTDLLAKSCERSESALAELEVRTRWGQTYDIEQMLEHAIVHILRHRRQIERWLSVIEVA